MHSVYSCACIVVSCALMIWANFISKLFANPTITIVAEQEWNEFLQRIEKEGDPMALCNLGYRCVCQFEPAHASTDTKDPSPSPRHFLSREPTETASFMVEQAT